MHKDQARVNNVLLPLLRERVSDPEAVRDFTILNRALIQGPDPLFLMETCPAQFLRLCQELELDDASGRDAIEKAHWQGPGVLLEGQGLALGDWNTDDLSRFSLAKKREMLWLVLASISDCTEDGYGPQVTILERFQRAMKAATALDAIVVNDVEHASAPAYRALEKFLATTKLTFDERGFPHTDVDHGFYVAYKLGHKVCAVKSGPLTFWGTTPDTTLAEQGVVVDTLLSPSFGFVR